MRKVSKRLSQICYTTTPKEQKETKRKTKETTKFSCWKLIQLINANEVIKLYNLVIDDAGLFSLGLGRVARRADTRTVLLLTKKEKNNSVLGIRHILVPDPDPRIRTSDKWIRIRTFD